MSLSRSPLGLVTLAVSYLAGIAYPVYAQDQPVGDAFDQFFRYTEREHKTFVQDIYGETIDPFTGTLRVVRQDLSLPGKGGLDLEIVRSYSSKIWGRADLLDMEPLLAEKDNSVLGYGWTFHMGRIKNPNATGQSGMCSGDFPVYESPDGTARVFYPVAGTAHEFVSKDFWRMQRNCPAVGGAGACIWTDTGIRYEFVDSWDNHYYYGGTILVWPVTAVVDPFGNRIAVSYRSQSGAVDAVIDTYGRKVAFSYSASVDGLRLDAMSVNGSVYEYRYTTYSPVETGVAPGSVPLPGPRRFLAEVRPPAGPSEQYSYAYDASVEHNQYALHQITYPHRGVITYGYESTPFFTGRDTVPFSVVTHRTVHDPTTSTTGEWTYSYAAPGPGSDFNVTSILRPDGKTDRYTIVGLGYIAGQGTSGQLTFAAGLTLRIERGDGAEVEGFMWDPNQVPPISPAVYSAPVYSGSCGPYSVWDSRVYVPVVTQRQLMRDGAVFTTEYSVFDVYGQPQKVVEIGRQSAFTAYGRPPDPAIRLTEWSYLSLPVDYDGATLNRVRGQPLTQAVCVEDDCYSNSWTYNPELHYVRTAECLSGVSMSFGYDAFGDLRSVADATGRTLTLTDYSHGTPTRLDFNGAYTVLRDVSWEGLVLSETDGRGHTTGYVYDAIGRIETLTPPGNTNATHYSYAADGSWVRATRGSYFQETYLDGFGRVLAMADSEGSLASTRYDNMGRVWFESYPYDASIGEVGDRLDRDGLGRVTAVTKGYRPETRACDSPGACTLSTEFVGNCLKQVEQLEAHDSRTTWRCYTSYGAPSERRLTQVMDAHAQLWKYSYNAGGKLGNVIAPSPQGNRTFQYDARQFLIGESSGEAGAVAYGRNNVGQMISRSDARFVTAYFGYDDALGRLRGVDYQAGSPDNVVLEYDNANNVTHVSTLNGGAYAYTYDALNRLVSAVWTFEGRAYATSYQYDSDGCLTGMTYPTGTVLSFTCDTANRITSVSSGGGPIVRDIAYHPSGRVRAMTSGNGQTTVVSYDDRSRIQSVTTPGVMGLRYSYDGASNVRSYENSAVLGSLRLMTYDHLDRLSTSVAPYLWGTVIYSYDSLGNRTISAVGTSTTSYSYDSDNRLRFAIGAQSRRSMTFTWDLAGRLASSSDGTSYQYDGRNRRVAKRDSQTTLYHYDSAGRIIAETLADGTRLRDYFYLNGSLVAVEGCVAGAHPNCSGERQWYHTDALGSVLARTDAAGAVVAQFDYAPWGELWTTPAVPGDRQYNGRVYDPETGFHDYGARMYWPEIGRFISPDTNRGHVENPASLNRYSYVLNNPYKYVDPSGREPALQQFVQQAANQPMGPQLTVITGGAAAGAGAWSGGMMLAWAGGAGLAGAGGWLAGTWLNDNWLGPHVQNAMDAVFGPPGGNTTAGGETPATKAGRAAHANYPAALGDDYEYEVVLPSGKRADAVHKSEPIVRELKPANARAEKRGQTQVDNYAKELQSMDPQQRKWEGVVDTYTPPAK